MDGCVDVWMRVCERVDGCVDVWTRVCGRVVECMDVWMVRGWVCGRVGACAWTRLWTCGRVCGRVCGRRMLLWAVWVVRQLVS